MERLINDDCFNIFPNIEESSVQLLFTSVPDINDLGCLLFGKLLSLIFPRISYPSALNRDITSLFVYKLYI